MNDQTQPPPPTDPGKHTAVERTKQMSTVAWIAGTTSLFCGITLVNAPIWPVAFGVAALATMVTIISCYILRRNQPRFFQ
jgi:hypothetical protein